MGSENRKIVKRIILGIPFELLSPLCVSNGEDNHTDKDVICDMAGNPFIPGTSLAGAIRNYLSVEKEEKTLFGYSLKNGNDVDGRMSSIYFSDAVLQNAKICYRDVVSLLEKSGVDNKFDWEIVDAGAVGCFWIEIMIRDGDSENEAYMFMQETIQGIQSGKLRLGYRKNRGFGKVKILSIYEWNFTKKNVTEWIAFERPSLQREKNKEDNEEKESWTLGKENICYKKEVNAWIGKETDKWRAKDKYASICVPLRLDGGISIRRYSTINGDADFEHITSNGNAVIPGTSWNGMIRSRCKEILEELDINENIRTEAINQWFGTVDVNSNKVDTKDAIPQKQSSIVIEESRFIGSKAVQISRNKVNRFDASTVTGALYTEVANFEGNTKLVVHIAKDESEWKAVVGLLLLVIQDIQNGFIAIGGQTSIGRGLLLENGEVQLEGCQREECEGEIAKWIIEHTKQ